MRVYLDTNILIEAVEGRTELSDTLASLLLKAQRRTPTAFVTSELTIAEVIVKPIQLGRDDLVRHYDELIRSSDVMEVLAIDRTILTTAAEIRARHQGLKLLDSIHLATALGAQCTHFLTNDHRLKADVRIRMVRMTAADLADLTSAFDSD